MTERKADLTAATTGTPPTEPGLRDAAFTLAAARWVKQESRELAGSACRMVEQTRRDLAATKSEIDQIRAVLASARLLLSNGQKNAGGFLPDGR